VKKITLISLLVISTSFLKGQTINIDSLRTSVKNDSTVFVYMTALWCSPCLEKMPYLDAYFSATKYPFKLLYLFDREGYSGEKLKKIFPFIDFKDKALFMPISYYSNAKIQINSHRRLFKKFILDNSTTTPPIRNLNQFDLASILILKANGDALVIESDDIKKLSRQELDNIILSKIK
jgi:thiol-disulfide isomerase/thioredoxin